MRSQLAVLHRRRERIKRLIMIKRTALAVFFYVVKDDIKRDCRDFLRSLAMTGCELNGDCHATLAMTGCELKGDCRGFFKARFSADATKD